MGRHEKVSPMRTWLLLLLLQGSVLGSVIPSNNEVFPDDYETDDWDGYDETGTSFNYWDRRNNFEDDATKILDGGPGSQGIREEDSPNFYNSLGSIKHNPYSVTGNQGGEEESAKDDDRAAEPAHTGSSHILPLIGTSVLASPSQSQDYFIIPATKEATFSVTSQTEHSPKYDSFKRSTEKQKVIQTPDMDMDHLSVKENPIYKEKENLMESTEEMGKQDERLLLRTSSNPPSITESEDNAYAPRNNIHTRKNRIGKVSVSKSKLLKNRSYFEASRYSSDNKSGMIPLKTFPLTQKLTEKAEEAGGERNQSSDDEENGNKRPGSSTPQFNIPYPIPIPYVMMMGGSNKATYKETGMPEPENTNEMGAGLVDSFANGAEVVLQRRNRSKRDAPDVETFSSEQNEEIKQEADPSSAETHQLKSGGTRDSTVNEPAAGASATNVKNSTPPPQTTNPIEALQRLTRLLDRMLRELSQFQQKFTLRLIRMTERQDIDQMQSIMQDFDISPEKPIFFIAGGLKTVLNGSVRTSAAAIAANLTQLLGANVTEPVTVTSGSTTETLSSSPVPPPVEVETTLAPLPSQETTVLPVELEMETSTTAAQVQAAEPISDMVIVTNGESIEHEHEEATVKNLTTAVPILGNPARRRRSAPEFADFQVFPVPGRQARTENPYDDFGEDGWIDFEERHDDDVGDDDDDKTVGETTDVHRDDESPELSPASPSKFIASNSAIDQSHALPHNHNIQPSSFEHASSTEAISESVIPTEKASVQPSSLSSSSSQMPTENVIALPNDSIMTVKEQQAERSNDHVDDPPPAAQADTRSGNIVNLNHTPPNPVEQTERGLISNSVVETKDSSLSSDEMEDKNGKEIIVLSHIAPIWVDSVGEYTILKSGDRVENPQLETRAITSSPVINAVPLADSKATVQTIPLHITPSSGLNDHLQSTETLVLENHVDVPLPTGKTNPVADSDAPHGLPTAENPILESTLGIPQDEINVKNNNPLPQQQFDIITTQPESSIPPLIKEKEEGLPLPTQKVANPSTSIENRAEKQVIAPPLLEATVSGLDTSAILKEEDVHAPQEKISLPPNADSGNLQDDIAISISPIAEITTEQKTSQDVIPLGEERESSGGRESFTLGEQGRIPVVRESVMKKVEEEQQQQPTNIEKGIEKLSPTFHAPTVLEKSQIMGNNHATFLPDKASPPNGISIHDNVAQPILIPDETDKKGVRNAVSGSSSFGEATLGESSQDTKSNSGEDDDATVNKLIPVPLLSEDGATNLGGKTVSASSVANDILTQPELSTRPAFQNIEVSSSDHDRSNKVASENLKTVVGESPQELATTAEKVKVEIPHKDTPEDAVKVVEEVEESKVASVHVEPLAEVDTVEPVQVVQKVAADSTSGRVASPNAEVISPLLAVENTSSEVEPVVKVSSEPEVLPPVVNVAGAKEEKVETLPENQVVVLKNAVPASLTTDAVKDNVAHVVQPQQVIHPTGLADVTSLPVESNHNAVVVPDDTATPTKILVENTVTSKEPILVDVVDPIVPLVSTVEVAAPVQESSNLLDVVSPVIPTGLNENIAPPLSPPTVEQNQGASVNPVSSDPVMAPISLAEDDSAIPNLPDTDLDSAFGIKPIATTPNLQIPGLKPSIPERPQPEYIDFVSQGVDMESLYFAPSPNPVVLRSPPVYSAYSPASIIQRQQQLMNSYFSGLLYRRALPY